MDYSFVEIFQLGLSFSRIKFQTWGKGNSLLTGTVAVAA